MEVIHPESAEQSNRVDGIPRSGSQPVQRIRAQECASVLDIYGALELAIDAFQLPESEEPHDNVGSEQQVEKSPVLDAICSG